MAQSTDRTKIKLPGGMEVVFALKEVPLPLIFTKLISAGCKPERMNPEDQEGANALIAGLDEEPLSLRSFVVRHRIYNHLSWANEKISMDEFNETVTISRIGESQPPLFETKLSLDFCAHNDIHSSSYLALDPSNGATWGKVQGRVVSYDPASGTIRFVTMRYRARVSEEKSYYNIQFHPSSFVFRSRDRTLNWLLILEVERFVFPPIRQDMLSKDDYRFEQSKAMLTLPFSRKISFNELQKAAIFAITSGHHGSTPFILHGPPGTGKTITLVESVRQLVLDKAKKARVLVCTPSNTAADLFASELLKTGDIPDLKIFRMYSLMREVDDQNQALRKLMCVCLDDDDQKVFGIYHKQELLRLKVVISTLSASTYMVSGGLQGEFTHIIIDEAGQSGELETLIPMVGLASLPDYGTKIVLAGDHKQLGPVETCEYINKKHLTASLMERYTKSDYYDKNDSRITCCLEENYRSHAAILKVPSKLFYDDVLRPAAEVVRSKDSLSKLEFLPKQGFPILFHNVTSDERGEMAGHSFCNEAEISVVLLYIERILAATDVRPSQIGIITPYKYQVRLLQEKLARYEGMTVDSVERFQGSERRVIIVSTVRSKTLGFLDDDKRFNTTIMRAEELLIVVGNEDILSKQSSWGSFLDYCRENEAIVCSNIKCADKASVDDDNVSHVSESEDEF